MKKHIPNILTLGNLLCGCMGIVFILSGNIYTGAFFVFPALVLDFLDGFVARILKVQSPIGKELDSLADMVTFGVLPGILILSLISMHYVEYPPLHFDYLPAFTISPKEPLVFIGLIFPLFAALRLAKFNVDESQSDSFVGIPTPAATMFIVGLLFLLESSCFKGLNIKLLLITVTIFISLAMVAPIRMINLKFKNFQFKENIFRFLLLICSVIALAIFQLGGLSLVIVLYICLSIVQNVVTKKP